MPFTAAHPAAVLPLRRFCPRVLVWSGLVIGSITPDLECFLTLRPMARHGLTLAGSFYFCLPAGLVLFAVWQSVVKRPAALLLPGDWRRAAWPSADRRMPVRLRNAAAVAISILIGAWLHQLWDSFTHARSWGVAAFPQLSANVAELGAYDLTVFRLLQHGSTLLGVTCLVVAAVRWKSGCRLAQAPKLREPLRIALVSLIGIIPATLAVTRGLAKASPYEGITFARQFVGFGVISAVSFAGLTLLLVGTVVTGLWGRLVTHPVPPTDAASARGPEGDDNARVRDPIVGQAQTREKA